MLDSFSSNRYIFLPTKKNPKVAISVDGFDFVKNGFKLYNPFSLKAKIFKKVVMSFYLYLNILGKFFSIKKEKSDFINYLEVLLKQPLVVSVYFATINDKVVLQLQSTDAKVLGYLKYPLNDVGLKHIENEIQAYELFSSLQIVEPYILSESYNSVPFLFLEELDGDIGLVEKSDLDHILSKLQRGTTYKLSEHPRILKIKKSLFKNNMLEYIIQVEQIVSSSIQEYKLVYEHGDFTPWNFVKVKEAYIPFDFEYFVEDGLEHLDIIKYYYQVGKLLEGKEGIELVKFIFTNVDIEEVEKILTIFLIKEILRGKEENESFKFEENILKVLEK